MKFVNDDVLQYIYIYKHNSQVPSAVSSKGEVGQLSMALLSQPRLLLLWSLSLLLLKTLNFVSSSNLVGDWRLFSVEVVGVVADVDVVVDLDEEGLGDDLTYLIQELNIIINLVQKKKLTF